MTLALIIIFAILVIVAAECILHYTPLRDDPENKAGREFRDYIARELHKAEAGAANTEAWAVALIERWRRYHG